MQVRGLGFGRAAPCTRRINGKSGFPGGWPGGVRCGGRLEDCPVPPGPASHRPPPPPPAPPPPPQVSAAPCGGSSLSTPPCTAGG
ncbi:hypothetical protein DI494_11060 [Stenotrophomonas maltophilia]|nr:hypothetical protein DI494_11060 [Stenotrophomonas maltophilia]